MKPSEQWKPVVGFEDLYQVSNAGRVRRDGRVLKNRAQKSGHVSVNLCRHAIASNHLVHRVVLKAFVGPPPPGMEACHYPDRDPANCNLDNLRWDTRKRNHADKRAHGTSNAGSAHPLAKVTESDVRDMFAYKAAGITQRLIAFSYGISEAQASRIFSGKRWRGVEA